MAVGDGFAVRLQTFEELDETLDSSFALSSDTLEHPSSGTSTGDSELARLQLFKIQPPSF